MRAVGATLALLWLLGAGLVACGGDEGEEHAKERPVPVAVVETAPVGRGDVRDLLVASAAVEAVASADLVPTATGRALQVLVDVGDRVRKGQALAVLENVSLDAGAEVARAEVDQLEDRVAELRQLFERGAVSERELEDLRYQLATARTRLREAARTAGDTRITSPIDGVVAARDLRVGELATSARRIFQVVDLSELLVRARLPERDVSRVRVGQPARLVSAYDEAAAADARVTRIAPVIDPTTGTFEVTLTLDPGQEVLRPGQYVSVQLEVDRREAVLVVPKDAVVYDNGVAVLFRVEREVPEGASEQVKVARRVPVALGLSDPLVTEIASGVAEGDAVVVVGQGSLRDGARVREPGDPKPSKDAPAEAGAEAAAAAEAG
ncbi:MAG: efflux RND transporter periplasmic adaptor subunit [Alphaproteobacteria bacterium]|nr:efflux RND transporter periplasmic adaptor subunit [Alphaproteobacteria bacterium]